MANFTTTEADASTIIRMDKVFRDNIFSEWIFGVVDADGNEINWEDSSVAEDASKTTIKTAIRNHLVEIKKQPAPAPLVVVVHRNVLDKGKGETVA